jgi:hypothetical protein
MNHSLILTLWSLRRLRSDELPQVAAEWLADGLDSAALRELAGISSPEMSEVGPLFEKAASQLQMTIPEKEEALAFLARHYAQQIVDGALSPYDGARRIWWQVSNELDAPSQLLLSFVGAASEIEDLPERSLQDGYDRKKYAGELEAMIIASARELLKTEPNQALQHNDPSCHVSCLRTPRASRDRG